MKKRAFIIRCQGLGLITEAVYLDTPPQADLDKWHALDESLHGYKVDAEGARVPRTAPLWIRVEEIGIVGDGPLVAALPDLTPLPESPPPQENLLMVAAASGRVIPSST